MVDARTTPRMTQQMMIMIFFCGGANKTHKGGSRQPSRRGITGAQGSTALQSRAFWEFGVGRRYLAGLALVFDGLLGVGHGSLHIVDGVLHVVLDSVNHLALKSNSNFQHVMPQWLSLCGSAEVGGRAAYLALDQHGHVDEHVVQLADAVFELDDLGVSGLDLVQGLLGHLGVHLDLRERAGLGHVTEGQRGKPANSKNIIIEKISCPFRAGLALDDGLLAFSVSDSLTCKLSLLPPTG